MVSRQNSLAAAKPVRLDTRDPIAQARRAESQRRQAAALKTWNSLDEPSCLDETFYREKIQPRLMGVTVAAIASALLVSEPYATNIRSGRCIPHPRHWLALAQLVGLGSVDSRVARRPTGPQRDGWSNRDS